MSSSTYGTDCPEAPPCTTSAYERPAVGVAGAVGASATVLRISWRTCGGTLSATSPLAPAAVRAT
eukprot:11173786-Lingulodinium_polyedra.AAC.1